MKIIEEILSTALERLVSLVAPLSKECDSENLKQVLDQMDLLNALTILHSSKKGVTWHSSARQGGPYCAQGSIRFKSSDINGKEKQGLVSGFASTVKTVCRSRKLKKECIQLELGTTILSQFGFRFVRRRTFLKIYVAKKILRVKLNGEVEENEDFDGWCRSRINIQDHHQHGERSVR